MEYLNKQKRIGKRYFLYGFVAMVMVLSISKWVYNKYFATVEEKNPPAITVRELDSIDVQRIRMDSMLSLPRKALKLTDAHGKTVKNRIYSVPDFGKTFPDLNDLQLTTAERLGVPPCPTVRLPITTKNIWFT